jgi:hypothetical protein
MAPARRQCEGYRRRLSVRPGCPSLAAQGISAPWTGSTAGRSWGTSSSTDAPTPANSGGRCRPCFSNEAAEPFPQLSSRRRERRFSFRISCRHGTVRERTQLKGSDDDRADPYVDLLACRAWGASAGREAPTRWSSPSASAAARRATSSADSRASRRCAGPPEGSRRRAGRLGGRVHASQDARATPCWRGSRPPSSRPPRGRPRSRRG